MKRMFKKILLIRKQKEYYKELGRLEAAKNFDKLTKEMSLAHTKSITNIQVHHNNELLMTNRKAQELEKSLEKKNARVDSLIEYLEATQQDIDVIHAETLRYYRNLREDYDNERKKKMTRHSYDKSSVEHLASKAEKIKNQAIERTRIN